MLSPRLDKDNGWISLRNDFRFFRFYFEIYYLQQHLQSWFLGGQVVPDILSGCRISPVDAMFQISAF